MRSVGYSGSSRQDESEVRLVPAMDVESAITIAFKRISCGVFDRFRRIISMSASSQRKIMWTTSTRKNYLRKRMENAQFSTIS